MEEPYSIDVEQAVEEHADMVYRLALLKTGQPADADDVFSEVFLSNIGTKSNQPNI